MHSSISKLALAATCWSLTAAVAIAQVAKPDKAAGPSGSDFIKDVTTWFSNHQGAGIAFGVGALVVVGMFIYNRLWPSTPAKK